VPHRKEELELVSPPRVNRGQLACVSARYAREETPAIAHFAAVHHHTDQILRTVGVNDRTDWMLRNIDRARRDLDILEAALHAGELPDLTERDRPTRFRSAFEGIPAGLRQPLDASRGRRDWSAAYRPARPRKNVSDVLGMAVAVIAVALAYYLIR
jgi:hypothetical protein